MSCGTRVQDFRPGDPDGARLLRSSLLINYSLTETVHCWYRKLLVASNSATLRQPAPSPVLRLLRLGTRLPNLAVRAPAADAFTEVLLHIRVLPLRYCSWRPLITAGHPVRSSVPSPPCNRSGFGTPPPHRPANCNCSTAARQFISAGPHLISATRETITTPTPNVYSG